MSERRRGGQFQWWDLTRDRRLLSLTLFFLFEYRKEYFVGPKAATSLTSREGAIQRESWNEGHWVNTTFLQSVSICLCLSVSLCLFLCLCLSLCLSVCLSLCLSLCLCLCLCMAVSIGWLAFHITSHTKISNEIFRWWIQIKSGRLS